METLGYQEFIFEFIFISEANLGIELKT